MVTLAQTQRVPARTSVMVLLGVPVGTFGVRLYLRAVVDVAYVVPLPDARAVPERVPYAVALAALSARAV